MVRRVGTLGESQGTVGWTDGLVSSCVRRIAEMKSGRQKHRMNRRSIGMNRRSIWWSRLNKTEMRQDLCSSTGWTDGSIVVHPTVSWKLTVGSGHGVFNTGWSDVASVHSVGVNLTEEPQRLSDVGGAPDEPMLLKSRRWFIRRSTFSEPLANG
jgi:hypothetical protein